MVVIRSSDYLFSKVEKTDEWMLRSFWQSIFQFMSAEASLKIIEKIVNF